MLSFWYSKFFLFFLLSMGIFLFSSCLHFYMMLNFIKNMFFWSLYWLCINSHINPKGHVYNNQMFLLSNTSKILGSSTRKIIHIIHAQSKRVNLHYACLEHTIDIHHVCQQYMYTHSTYSTSCTHNTYIYSACVHTHYIHP